MPINKEELRKSLEGCNKELEELIQQAINSDKTKEDNVQAHSERYPNLFKIYKEHEGLCDLMCNYFTIINAANVANKKLLLENFKHTVDNTKCCNYDKLENLSKTHILSLASFVELVKFLFFKIVPNSIFKSSEERKLIKSDGDLDKKIMGDKLDALPLSTDIKFSGFSTKFGLPTTGHSMLISKVGKDEYMFFNPDNKNPSCKFLSKEQLVEELSGKVKNYDRVAFIDNKALMAKVDNKILESINIDKSINIELSNIGKP